MNRRALVLAFLLLAPARVRGLESETRYINALNVNDGITWVNESNAFGETEDYARTYAFSSPSDYAGGNFQDITATPTGAGLTDFKIRMYDWIADHVNDTLTLEIYNPHTSAWETLETFDSGNLLPSALTTFDYTTAMQTKYAAASDKTAFLNGLQFRLYFTAKQAGADGVYWVVAWAKFMYEGSVSEDPPMIKKQTLNNPVLTLSGGLYE